MEAWTLVAVKGRLIEIMVRIFHIILVVEECGLSQVVVVVQ